MHLFNSIQDICDALIFLSERSGISKDELALGMQQVAARYAQAEQADELEDEQEQEAPPATPPPPPEQDEGPPEQLDLAEPRVIVLQGPATADENAYHAFVDAGGRVNTQGHRFTLTPTPARDYGALSHSRDPEDERRKPTDPPQSA